MSMKEQNPKIIQIIPAPQGMNVYYETGHQNSEGHSLAWRKAAACLALVEWQEGYREVVPMVSPAQGEDGLYIASEWDKFVSVGFEQDEDFEAAIKFSATKRETL